VAELEESLRLESDALSSLQQKAMQQLEVNNRRESSELEQKIDTRRTMLDHMVSLVLSRCQRFSLRCETE